MPATSRPLRLAEAVGVLSLATDLAMAQPLEHGLRTAVLAVRLARAMGLPEADQVTVWLIRQTAEFRVVETFPPGMTYAATRI